MFGSTVPEFSQADLGAKRPFMRQLATTKLAADRQIEHGWVARAPSIWSVFQIDQTCLGRSGGFAPVSLPLFQATVYEALG